MTRLGVGVITLALGALLVTPIGLAAVAAPPLRPAGIAAVKLTAIAARAQVEDDDAQSTASLAQAQLDRSPSRTDLCLH